METIKKSIELIISPLGIMVILIFAGIILSLIRRRRPIGFRLLTIGGVLYLFFLFSPLAKFLMLGLETQYSPLLELSNLKYADRIVILAGYAEDFPNIPATSRVSVQTIGTVSEGLRLYRLNPKAKLITSGGVVRNSDRAIAFNMAKLLEELGVPAQDLIVEGNSHTTYENLVEVKKIIGSRPFILVTQACDMKRAAAVARKLQMHYIPAPACFWTMQHFQSDISFGQKIAYSLSCFVHPSMENLSRIQWAYHEYLGMVWYRFNGRI
jgi:uncharacterized SAM-binding protein YcdF (DUF218 family)